MGFSNNPPTQDVTVLIDWLTQLNQKLVAYLSSLPGAQIEEASIDIDRLINPKSLFPVMFFYPGNLAAGTATINSLWAVKFPYIDGGAATFTLHSWSRAVRSSTPQAGNHFNLEKNEAGSPFDAVELAGLTTPDREAGDFASAYTFVTGDRLDVDYIYNDPGTPPVYTDTVLILWFSVNHMTGQ